MTHATRPAASAESFAEIRARSEAEWEAWQHPVRPRIEIALDTSSIPAGAGPWARQSRARLATATPRSTSGARLGSGLQWLNPTVTISWPDGTRVVYGPVRPEHAAMLLDEATGRVGRGRVDHDRHARGLEAGRAARSSTTRSSPTRPERRLLARIGYTDPESIEHYIAGGGYYAVQRMFTRHQGAEAIRQAMLDAGLTGRGGAYFPAGHEVELPRDRRQPGALPRLQRRRGRPGRVGEPHHPRG